MTNDMKQAAMDRAGELPVERRVGERRVAAVAVANLGQLAIALFNMLSEVVDAYETHSRNEHCHRGTDDKIISDAEKVLLDCSFLLAAPAVPVAAELPTTLIPNWAGEFATFQQWVNKAQSWLESPSHRPSVCIDAKGRRCAIGKDFMLARDEGAFPVRFFWDFVEAAAPVLSVGLPSQPTALLTEVADVLAEQNWRGDLVEALRDAAKVSLPSQPTEQSGCDSALHAEPAGQHDAVRSAALEEAARVAETLTRVPSDLLGLPPEWMARIAGAGARISAAIRALPASAAPVPRMGGNTKPESSPIAEPDTATQAAKPLTDDEIYNAWLHRDCMDAIRAGDMRAQFISAVRSIESHLKGE